MARKKAQRESNIVLGKNIERMRRLKDMTRMQLGRKINKIEKQIAKYEAGEFVPLPVLEDIGLAFDEPVAKKIIRKISYIRKLEVEIKTQMEDELIELYNEALFIEG